MRKSFNDDDGGEDEDEVEQRRREYLRRHREMLLQKQRLETERRLQEQERDKTEIQKRLEDIRSTKQKDALALLHAAAHPLASTTAKEQTASQHTSLPGIYSRVDHLNADTLRLVAEQQSLRDMAPLNTRGKYHARYMKHSYPIAGAQLKIEKECELCIAAKKKLLLTNTLAANPYSHEPFGADVGKPKSESMKRSLSLGNDFGAGAAYRKLDFYVGKMTGILKNEEQSVNQAHVNRQIRFVEVQHGEGLSQFWTLFHASHKREVVAWLKSHSFVDVNVPVRLAVTKTSDLVPQLRVVPDKELGMTPLMAACKYQCVDMVTELFEQGAVVHLVTANGDSALHFLWREWLASFKSSPVVASSSSLKGVAELAVRATSTFAILTALIAHKVDVNAQNNFGETALQVCARFGLEDCAKLLLAYRADAFALDRHGKSAVMYAKESNHDNLHRILLNYDVIERTRARERARKDCEALLRQGRGALTANWSQLLERLFGRLLVEDQRAGHLRSQYVDRKGQVIVCNDEEEEEEEEEN